MSASRSSSRTAFREKVRRRLGSEAGALGNEGAFPVALVYPSPYRTGMSSLGFQRIYRALQEAPGLGAERAFLDDDAKAGEPHPQLLTYESLRPVGDFPVFAVSVAYEIEIGGLVQTLDGAGVPVFREDRDDRHPFVLGGGPLTFSNPTPLSPYCDAVVMGEAETLVVDVVNTLASTPGRAARLAALAKMDHVWVPAIHGEQLPSLAQIDDALLPAWGPLQAQETELAGMFLVETSRGCSRGCRYCVMRRSTNGGMRIVPKETILDAIPGEAKRVGLVGAAVSDHPHIVEIVRTLTERGASVGLSSLRPDKLKLEFVQTLKAAGYRTLTTAMDGPSERMRQRLDRRAEVRHLLMAAENARAVRMERLKLYLMIGLPGETDDDIDECVRFTTELSKISPVALGIAPFCPKRNTPMVDEEFAGIQVVEHRLDRLRRGLKGRADVRSISAKWAWVEAVLAHGGDAEGRAVRDAIANGGSFAAWKRAFAPFADAKPKKKGALPIVA
ncbi:MAG: radical SAM protein [Deltaproteobacteria bacterium]|nr:radical SAM protein [Deltaproteobacteria bacterium]